MRSSSEFFAGREEVLIGLKEIPGELYLSKSLSSSTEDGRCSPGGDHEIAWGMGCWAG